MNPFMKAAINAVNRNGRNLSYFNISTVVDKIKGTVSAVKTEKVLKIYPKSVKVTQYNYPDLIGKSVIVFYLANFNLGFTPKPNDEISYNGKIYIIRSYDFHEAHGENCLYRLTGVS